MAIVAFALVVFMALLGTVAQQAILNQAQTALQSTAGATALAAAQSINNPGGTAPATATSYVAQNPIKGMPVTMATGYPALKCLTTLTALGMNCNAPDNANAIQVKVQTTVPLVFGKIFGETSKTIGATATASMQGGTASPLDVMIIVDTTASMNNSDTSCSVSGATRLTCAEAGARTLLQQFDPSQVQVGLMVFPGLTSATKGAYTPYNCSTGPKPTIASYAASPVYQIIPLASDYKTSSAATSLNSSSNLVRALGGGPSGCTQGLVALGGYGTYYASVITAAQTALTSNGRSGVQKVIIFLSDGDANAKASNVPSGQGSNQCHEGITAANAVTAAGTWVYTAAYGSPTGATPASCSTDTSSPISACSAMQQMASSSKTFFSTTVGGTSSCTSIINDSPELVGLFGGIGSSLMSGGPRLIPNSTN